MGGGGGIISSIFGGGSQPSAPKVQEVEYKAAPVRESEQEAESKSVRDTETRKLKARRGMSGTILTSPLGTGGGESGGAGSGMLGRSL